MIKAKIALGPMSKEIIEAVYKYSDVFNVQLMLIASKNQIDYDGGYVNNWNTKEFSSFCSKINKNYPKSNVLICRDHCGPGFNKKDRKENIEDDLQDSYRTMEEDIANNFNLIHIDLCNLKCSHEEKLRFTAKCIKKVYYLNPKIMVEIGTDENDGNVLLNLERLKQDIDYIKEYCDPSFYVVKTGSLVKEVQQVGEFDCRLVREISDIVHDKELFLKEHNADYLGHNDLILRRDVVDAINIAPMLGVIQTKTILLQSDIYGIDSSNFLEVSYNSRKWEKWMYKNDQNNKYLCSLIAGHYNYNTKEYKKLFDRLSCRINVAETIIKNVIDVINHYQIGVNYD